MHNCKRQMQYDKQCQEIEKKKSAFTAHAFSPPNIVEFVNFIIIIKYYLYVLSVHAVQSKIRRLTFSVQFCVCSNHITIIYGICSSVYIDFDRYLAAPHQWMETNEFIFVKLCIWYRMWIWWGGDLVKTKWNNNNKKLWHHHSYTACSILNVVASTATRRTQNENRKCCTSFTRTQPQYTAASMPKAYYTYNRV